MIELTIFIIILIVLLIITLVYASRASTQLQSYSGYENDPNLKQASRYLVGISIAGWISLILLVGGIIFLFTYGEELFLTPNGTYILDGILLLVIILTLITGVISALASEEIGKSSAYPTGDTGSIPILKSYEFSVVAAVTGILVFISAILILVYTVKGNDCPPCNPSTSDSTNPIDLALNNPSLLEEL